MQKRIFPLQMIFLNSTSYIIKSGFLKVEQTIYNIQFTSPSLSDPPLSIFHSFPKILSLTPLSSRREPGGHQFSLRTQSFPIDQKELCSIPLMGMEKSFYWQY